MEAVLSLLLDEDEDEETEKVEDMALRVKEVIKCWGMSLGVKICRLRRRFLRSLKEEI